MAWIRIWQVDAFTDRLYAGNPAAVCLLEDDWLSDEQMQAIAAENNLSETAFLLPGDAPNRYGLRWMTPTTEVQLCGHATLASAFVVQHHLAPVSDTLHFDSRFSGELRVGLQNERLALDFPARPTQPADMDKSEMIQALGKAPLALHHSAEDWIAEFASEADVGGLAPDFAAIARLPCRGLIATAPGASGDAFVSRFFGPAVGVPEDPVTGSAHCALTPFWAEKTGHRRFHARQIGPRGGALTAELKGDRVELAGQAVMVLEGRMQIPD